MNELNIRFIEFYNFIISQKIVSNGKEFASSIDVSTSIITEISKGRSIVGTKIIQNSIRVYGLNADWLFTGDGEMIKSNKMEVKQVDGIWILNRFEEIVAENALLKRENEELKLSRGNVINTPAYPVISEKIGTHMAADPGTSKHTR